MERIAFKEVLEGKHPQYKTSSVAKKLISQGYKDYCCEECGITNWRGLPIVLQLHHINCKENDHRLENLQLLCPNCHTQRHPAGTRKVKKKRQNLVRDSQLISALLNKENIRQALLSCHLGASGQNAYRRAKRLFEEHIDYCGECGNKKLKTNQFCSVSCGNSTKRLVSNEAILKALEETKKKNSTFNFVQAGKSLGISDNAVRKRYKRILGT